MSVELAYPFRNPVAGATGPAAFVKRMDPGSLTRSGIVTTVVESVPVPVPVTFPVRVTGRVRPVTVDPVKSMEDPDCHAHVPIKGTPLEIVRFAPVVNVVGVLKIVVE